MEHIFALVRLTDGTKSSTPSIGRHGGDVSSVGGERREDVCAGKGRVCRNRLLPEDQPFELQAYAVPGGWHRAGGGYKVVRDQRQEPKRTLQLGASC